MVFIAGAVTDAATIFCTPPTSWRFFQRQDEGFQPARCTMVSQNISSSATDVAAVNRGFVTDTIVTPRQNLSESYLVSASSFHATVLPHFWRSVIAGTLTFMTIEMLSNALMFACRVGIDHQGGLSFGWGAAIWIVIGSCVAYFFGGWAATCVGERSDVGWVRGLGIWALSLPLTTLFAAIVFAAVGIAYGPNTAHMTEYLANNSQALQMHQGNIFVSFAGAWTTVASLLCGLFFSMLGANMPPASSVVAATNSSMDRT